MSIKKHILGVGQKVIEQEASSLLLLGKSLTNSFCTAVDLIIGLRGRLIVSGVGKSGHIGRKIASTFTSTGTPAFYLHPSEASHGDLGIIRSDDLAVVLSRSGESSELQDMLIYCKQRSVPVISVTTNSQSMLAKASTCTIIIPNIQEACPLGLAPTTSTIMMLAIGDSLAAACTELKSFTKSDFKVFHPAGKLGLNLLTVSELMHTGEKLPLVCSDATLSHAILEITRCRFGCVGITDVYGYLIGVFTDGDLRRSLGSVELTQPISSLMVRNPSVLDHNAFGIEAAEIFRNRRIPSVFICEAGKPIGILHIHDLLQRGLV
jgi:arabinose-5-phosphate isomerase